MKLTYFTARGRAEAIRIAAAYGGLPLEDKRYAGAELMRLRASGEIKPPFHTFPFLELEDGTLLAQSASILRYVAKKAGVYPADEVKAALADSVVDQCADIASAFYNIFYNAAYSSEEKAKHAHIFISEKAPVMLQGIAAIKGAHKMLLGDADDSLCLADIAVATTIDNARNLGVDLLTAAPELKSIEDAVLGHPKLQAYFKLRAEVEVAETAAAAAAAGGK